jgi:hypothetical protein
MNEPAFPTKINTEHFSHPSTIYNTGMTLRDYFAAKSLQAIRNADWHEDMVTANDAAILAYQDADAMLKAREA